MLLHFRMQLRRALVRIGHILAIAWSFVVSVWRRRASGADERQHAVDALRRRYAFGAVGRKAFDEGVRKLGGVRRRRFRRKRERAA